MVAKPAYGLSSKDEDGTKTWKGVTWRRGERLLGARGKNRGVLATVRYNKRRRAQEIADEVAERARIREAERAEMTQLTKCPTCKSTDPKVRLIVQAYSTGEKAVVVNCNDRTFHPKKNRKKRHPFKLPNGGEMMEKVL